MTHYPSISVIIPTWNNAATIEATIRSCLNQTVPVLEILVCDDGSTDTTRQVVESIQDTRIRWIDSAHSGAPAVPRNNGMKLAQGEWFAFCDSDDQWLPEKLEKQLLTLKHSPYRACVTNASIKIDGVITSRTVSTWKKNKLGFKNLLQSNDIICSSVVFHRSIFKEIGGFPEDSDLRSFEDYGYWLRVSTRTEFLYINEALVIYDDHPATSIRSRNLPASLIRKKVFSDITIWIKNTIRLHASLSFILMIKIKELKIHLRRLIE